MVLALVIRDPSLSSCSRDKQGYLCISVSSAANESMCIQTWAYRIRVWMFSVTCRSEPNTLLSLFEDASQGENAPCLLLSHRSFPYSPLKTAWQHREWTGITQRSETIAAPPAASSPRGLGAEQLTSGWVDSFEFHHSLLPLPSLWYL